MSGYLGLDLIGGRVRAVLAEGSGRKLRVKRFAQADLTDPEAPPSAFLDKGMSGRLDRFLKDHKLERDPSALGWDSALTTFREMDLPFTSADQLRKVIKFECESHILNCDIDDVVVSFFKLAETPDKSHLMTMAVRKDHLMNRLETLQAAGVDPMVVELDVLAAYNTLVAIGFTAEHPDFALIDCGRRTTALLLVRKGRLVLARSIRIGADALTARLAGDLAESGGVEAARRLLTGPREGDDDLLVPAPAENDADKRPAELERDLALARVEDFQGKLGREIRRTLATHAHAEPPARVFVTGAGAELPGFAERAGALFGLDVPGERLDLLSRVEHDLEPKEAAAAEPELLTALGLCFKLAGADATQVDFRQEEARYTRKFDQVKEPLVYFCSFLLFFVLILNLGDVKALSVKEPFLVRESSADVARIHKFAAEHFQKALGTERYQGKATDPSVSGIDVMERTMAQHIDSLKAELGRGGGIPEFPSAFQIWRDSFDAIQTRIESIEKLMLTQIRVGVRTEKNPYVSLSGLVPSQASLEDLLEALRTVPNVEKVERPRTTVTPENLVEFKDLRVTFPQSMSSEGT